jgi:hypothetical protein
MQSLAGWWSCLTAPVPVLYQVAGHAVLLCPEPQVLLLVQ